MQFSFNLKRILVLAVPLILLSSATLCWTISSSRASGESGSHQPNMDRGARRETTLKPGRAGVAEAYGKLPIRFEENRGQTDPRVKFHSRASGSELFLTSTGAVIALRKTPDKAGAEKNVENESDTFILRMSMVGANPAAEVVGCDRLPGNSNYLRGTDPTKWQSNIPTYSRVQYRDLYPGVNLVYYGNQRQLEYDFEIAPGTNPDAIRMAFEGASTMRINGNGDLILRRGNTEVRMRKPSIYQESNGTRQPIAGHYVRRGRHQVGFEVGKYDKSMALVIDPVLTYSTFLGGTNYDYGRSIALDADGNAYVTGQTSSFNFPVTITAYSSTYVNGYDVFVTKLNADGTALIYSTYLGGNSEDIGYGIALDSSGNAYVVGSTSSTNYPTTLGAFQTSLQSTYYNGDAFVTKLNADGTGLVYSTYLGGSNVDVANGIALDSSGNAYVAGYTYSGTVNFPTTAGVLQTAPSAGSSQEAFVTELNTTGTALVYSTFLGGTGADQATAIKVDSSGNAYVAGMTTSENFDVTTGAYQTTYGGGSGSYYPPNGDGFASKLNPTATALVYSTYLGGAGDDGCLGLDLTASGEVYFTGSTNSGNFPTTSGVVRVGNGGMAKSTNGADSWFAQNSGLTNSTELSLAIDPSNPNVVFVGSSGGGVFKSTNGGANWAAVNSGLTDLTIRALTIDSMTTSTIFLGTNTRGVFRSTDSGATWRAINTGQNGMSVNTIKIDPANSSTVYAGTDSGIFKTTNGGATWAVSKTGPVSAIAIDPSNPSTLYAGIAYSAGLYKSTNGGGNWSATGLAGTAIRSLVLDPSATSTIYAGTDNGVQKSTDGGTTWSGGNIVLANKSVNALAISPMDSATIYAGTGHGVFKSTNGGSAWSPANTGLAGAVVNALAIDPMTPLTLYAGSAAGSSDAFVTKLNAAGAALEYSTYLGGSGFDQGYSVAIDASGNAYVTGTTSSQNFPTTRGGFDVFGGYNNDAFVTKLNPMGAALVYSMYLGGTDYDYGYGIAVDSAGSAYVVGITQSQNFPTTAGSFQSVKVQYNADAFISKVAVLPSLTANLVVTITPSAGPFSAGSYVSYNITLTNNGPERATSILVSDDLPPSLSFNSCSSSSNYCTHAGNSVIFSFSWLDPGASVNMQISANVGCSIPSSATIENTVTVDSSATDPDLSDNTAMATISATNTATTMLYPTSQLFPIGGGTGYVTVDRGANCTWTSMSNANWITITYSGNYGYGNVNYNVAANPGGPRMGTMTLAGQTFTVNQAGTCTYSLDRTSQSFPGNGGTGTVNVTPSDPACVWFASTSSSFITITSGSNGTGNGTVQYSVGFNGGSTIRNDTINIAGQTFTVYQGINFADVPTNDAFYTAIGKLSARGVTLGCGGSNYCPNQVVAREQMAAFILRAKGEFNPPTPGSQRFQDVPPSNSFYKFIDRLAVLQITGGCQTSPPMYCPGDSVRRDQMAAFIIRGLGEFNPPDPAMQRFDDVPPANPFYKFIDRMAVLQITQGCSASPPLYCPTSNVTRAQMAAFLVRAFNL